MKNKHRKRIGQLLKKKQRKLGDYLNTVLMLSYFDSCSYDVVVGSGEEEEDDDEEEGNDNNMIGGESRRVVVIDETRNDRLRYYQGFHDVGSIILSALGGGASPSSPSSSSSSYLKKTPEHVMATSSSTNNADDHNDLLQDLQEQVYKTSSSMGLTLACQVLLRISHSHLRDAMRPNFQQLQSALKLIVMPLTATFDPQLHAHLYDCEMEPYFCLSWVITWFSHDIRDTAVVKRLFDFFIVSHPLMAVYMSVAMMIHPLNRIEILGTDCDFACVHNALADLPKNSSNVGWKYLPGDNPQQRAAGYVTGDDADDMSYDPSLQDQSIDEGDDNGSVISSNLIGGGGRNNRARVPFQELIDLSVSLM